ncbi:carboxynorspermidine decarboxylase [Methylomonas sp. MgM2]
MMAESLKRRIAHSPAFILDLDRVHRNLQSLRQLRQATGCKVLYSMKALPLASLLSELKDRVDGVSVSSLYEARLAKEIFGHCAGLHLTTPGLRQDEFVELAALCGHISFNSLSQYRHLHTLAEDYSKGLRVNPKLSFADDLRYDPCRPHSKLGVDVELLRHGLPADIEGLHFHTVFSQTDLQPLLKTFNKLEALLRRHRKLKWLNLGGGYLFHSIADLAPLIALVGRLKSELVDEVYLEPGKAIVGNAGYLLTTIVDRFESDGKTVLVLDTSVNHQPKVFEYQIKSVLAEEDVQGANSAILAGSTCLAGDVFGEYRFASIPGVGDKLLFADVGAYTMIKANRFNGYPMPAVYLHRDGDVELSKADAYPDYRNQWFA